MKAFEKVAPKKTFQEVARRIRGGLIDGTLKPGDRLPPEVEIATGLKVSRTTVREALRALEDAGVVTLKTGKGGGAYVSSGSPAAVSTHLTDLFYLQAISIENLTEARIEIEDAVVRMACLRATDEDLARLDANIDEAIALHREGRFQEKAARNIEFHNLLAAASKNPVFQIVMRTLTDVIAAFQRRAGAETGTAVFRSRRQFMVAMHARDVDTAVAVMNRNMRRIGRVYARLARAQAGAARGAAPTAGRPRVKR